MESDNCTTLEIQKTLNKMKIGDPDGNLLIEDGIMGNKTIMSITKFQYIVKQQPTGKINKETCNVMESILKKPILKIGTDKYLETRYLQWRLSIYVDGVFGNTTRIAVMRIQKDNGLLVDGVVGEDTWSTLI